MNIVLGFFCGKGIAFCSGKNAILLPLFDIYSFVGENRPHEESFKSTDDSYDYASGAGYYTGGCCGIF